MIKLRFDEIRAKKGISIYDIQNAGIKTNTIKAIRNGGNITLETLNKLCEVLDCEPEELILYAKKGDYKTMIEINNDQLVEKLKEAKKSSYEMIGNYYNVYIDENGEIFIHESVSSWLNEKDTVLIHSFCVTGIVDVIDMVNDNVVDCVLTNAGIKTKKQITSEFLENGLYDENDQLNYLMSNYSQLVQEYRKYVIDEEIEATDFEEIVERFVDTL